MTLLELVNDVLIRLREPVVTTYNETTYSTLVAKFVNDAKRQVEDSFGWNSLGQTITVTTVASTPSYSLTGAGQKFQVMDDYYYRIISLTAVLKPEFFGEDFICFFEKVVIYLGFSYVISMYK